MTSLYSNFRERIFNRILRVDPGLALNSPESSTERVPGTLTLDLEIKQSLNLIQAEVVSPDGRQVDYHSITSSNSYKDYRKLTGLLAKFDFRSLSSREEKLAFWINLYNALVIDAVIHAKVQSSVTEGWLGILRFFHQAAYLVGGERFSLSDIEHGILRENSGFPNFPGSHFPVNDPREKGVIKPVDYRIHFALNCASNSCPPIGVYSPDQIESQLDLAARSFINSDIVLENNRKQISLSRIFRWYWGDFGGKEGIRRILEMYLEHPQHEEWNPKDLAGLRLKFHPYDWGLNKLS